MNNFSQNNFSQNNFSQKFYFFNTIESAKVYDFLWLPLIPGRRTLKKEVNSSCFQQHGLLLLKTIVKLLLSKTYNILIEVKATLCFQIILNRKKLTVLKKSQTYYFTYNLFISELIKKKKTNLSHCLLTVWISIYILVTLEKFPKQTIWPIDFIGLSSYAWDNFRSMRICSRKLDSHLETTEECSGRKALLMQK